MPKNFRNSDLRLKSFGMEVLVEYFFSDITHCHENYCPPYNISVSKLSSGLQP